MCNACLSLLFLDFVLLQELTEVDQLNLDHYVATSDVLLDFFEFLLIPSSSASLLLVLFLLSLECLMHFVHSSAFLEQSCGWRHRIELNVAGCLIRLHIGYKDKVEYQGSVVVDHPTAISLSDFINEQILSYGSRPLLNVEMCSHVMVVHPEHT